MKTFIHVAANTTAATTAGITVQQIFYLLYSDLWLDFSLYTTTQVFFQVMYLLSIALVAMSNSIKGDSLEPSKSYKSTITNTYKTI